MLMEVIMKEIGLMIKHQVKEFLCILTDQYMKENSSMIYKKEKVLKNGRMEVSLRVTSKMGRRKEMEFSSLLMGLYLKVVFISVRLKELVRRFLLMNQLMKEIGKTICFMAKEFSIGLTEEITKVIS